MKKLIIIAIFCLIATPVFAYDYVDDSIQLTILKNGSWILSLEGITYYLDWIDGRLRTTGLDGTCYWYDGEISQCSLREYSAFVSNLK